MPEDGPLVDPFGRAHTYLRISVTDRCNLRCVYCLPATGVQFMPRKHLLSYEEIARLAGIFVSMGIQRIRLTGGEPTVRRDLPELVRALGGLGLTDLSMTTNAMRFSEVAEELAEAGLTRVNISLDTLDPERFRQITRGGEIQRVLDGISAARDAGLTPVKVNCVVVRGENESDVEAMIEAFAPYAESTQVRFIEKMPFGAESPTFVPTSELRERIAARWSFTPVPRAWGVGPARTWRLDESGLVVGFISPMSEHFCEQCNRLRLQANGELRTCLSRDDTPSLKDLMRGGLSDQQLELAIRGMVWGKVAGHEAHLDGEDFRPFDGVMTTIGG